jgi:CheY-like chemotaxis protein
MKRVLVVDDEPAIRALVSASLESVGYRVTAFAAGTEALASLPDSRPDLILLDIGLPGLSGADVLRRLRSDATTASIPVLLLTGLEPAPDLEPDGILLKPFTPSGLRACVEGWLG